MTVVKPQHDTVILLTNNTIPGMQYSTFHFSIDAPPATRHPLICLPADLSNFPSFLVRLAWIFYVDDARTACKLSTRLPIGPNTFIRRR